MRTSIHAEALARFVEQINQFQVESTSATVVNHSGNLYNVDGSTSDPKIDGKDWKPLLIAYGIDHDCYVTNVLAPPSSTHPNFNVGGHMTSNSNGHVGTGGKCYLMPLCSWHNNKARDGMVFTHTETMMLELAGYMQGELAVTFLARLPSADPFSIIYLSDVDWATENLSAARRSDATTLQLSKRGEAGMPQYYVLLRRVQKGDRMIYDLEEANLPS